MTGNICPCGSGKTYKQCCGRFHLGKLKPATPEELMRSRYSAYALNQVEYLIKTTHPDSRTSGMRVDIAEWAAQTKWIELKVLSAENNSPKEKTGIVEFIAYYTYHGKVETLHERSVFKKHKGLWYYVNGDVCRP